jgi:hypothetical protein
MKLEIVKEECPENPRDMPSLGKMVCFHRRYSLGDKHDLRSDDFGSWKEIEQHLVELGAVVILPIYLYDHGGLRMSTVPFGCRWDSGQVGFIYATAEDIRAEIQDSAQDLTATQLESAKECLQSEILVYDKYLEGDVWSVMLTDGDGEIVENCGSVYGYDNAKAVGKDMIDEYVK